MARNAGRWSAMGVVLLAAAACSEEAGSSAPPEVVSLVAVEPSEACPAGGSELQHGVDTNGNGRLDAEELDEARSETLCFAPASSTSAALLTHAVVLEPGADCPQGGYSLAVGLDLDGSGTLEEGEVTSTQPLCENGSTSSFHVGNIELTDASDWEKYAQVQVVLGDLTVAPTVGGKLELSHLRAVSGKLELANAGTDASVPLTGVSLPALESVGALRLSGTSDLTSFSAPELSDVLGDLELLGNVALETVQLPSLERAGALFISANNHVVTLSLPLFTRTTRSFSITSNTALTTLSLPELEQVELFALQANVALTEVVHRDELTASMVTIISNTQLDDCAWRTWAEALSPAASPIMIAANRTGTSCSP